MQVNVDFGHYVTVRGTDAKGPWEKKRMRSRLFDGVERAGGGQLASLAHADALFASAQEHMADEANQDADGTPTQPPAMALLSAQRCDVVHALPLKCRHAV